jgi:hypothetical protein
MNEMGMNEMIRDLLARVSIDTMQKLAFIFAAPEDDPGDEIDQVDLDNLAMAKVTFGGPFSGCLVMAISKHVLPELTLNMLGMDSDEDTPVQVEQQYDVLKETLNIICGNVLPEIGGKKSVFNLGSPEIMENPEKLPNGEAYSQKITAYLSVDDGQCSVSLLLKDYSEPLE